MMLSFSKLEMMNSILLLLLMIISIPGYLYAQSVEQPAEIASQGGDSINVLAGFPDVEAQRKALGLSLGAARVYNKEHGFSIAGYTEMLYQKFSDTTGRGPTLEDLDLTMPRAVVFLGYRLSERVVINSEFRVDRDLFDTDSIEGSVDLAYLDYIMNPAFTIRAGIVLVPMGLINEFHQPNEYLGTRPGFGDLFTIPSIWHALGFGFAGHKWGFDYRAYVISGLNAAKFTEFGLRDGREITSDTIGSPSVVYRIDYNFFRGGTFGGSYYLGNSGIFGSKSQLIIKFTQH